LSGTTGTFSGVVDVAEYIKHTGDTDTYIQFQLDRITQVAGTSEFIDFGEGGQDWLNLGHTGDVDVNLRSGSGSINMLGSNGYIGINDTSPSYALDVNAIANFVDEVYVGGNVGIGTVSPVSTLNVIVPSASAAHGASALIVAEGTSTGDMEVRIGVDGSSNYGWISTINKGTGVIPLILNGTGGNVGIGQVTPNYLLDLKITDSGTGNTNGIVGFLSNASTTDDTNVLLGFGRPNGNNYGMVGFKATDESASEGDFVVRTRDTGGTNNFGTAFIVQNGDDVTVGPESTTPRLAIGQYAPSANLGVYGDVSILSNSNTLPGVLAIRTTDSTSVTDDILARIFLESSDGGESTLDAGTVIEAIASETQSSSNKGSHLAFRTKANATALGGAATEHMRITQNGNVGIGTASPEGGLNVHGTYTIPSTGIGNSAIFASSSDGLVADKGGVIQFGGSYTSGGDMTQWAGIAGLRDNATDGNYAGYMSFYTRAQGAAPVERMRINSAGNTTFNGTIDSGAITSSGLTVDSGGGHLNAYLQTDTGTGYDTALWCVGGASNSENWIYLGYDGDENNAYIKRAGTTGNLLFGVDNATKATLTSTGLTIAGFITCSSSLFINSGERFYLDGGSNTYINEFTADHLGFFTGGTEALRFTDSQNAQFAGTIQSGAITSTAGISGTTGSFTGVITTSQTANPTGLTVDVGLPSAANRQIALFQAVSSRQIALGWIDSGSKMTMYTPGGHSIVLGAGVIGTNHLEITTSSSTFAGSLSCGANTFTCGLLQLNSGNYGGAINWGNYSYQQWAMAGSGGTSYISLKSWVSNAWQENVRFNNDGTTLFNKDATFAGSVASGKTTITNSADATALTVNQGDNDGYGINITPTHATYVGRGIGLTFTRAASNAYYVIESHDQSASQFWVKGDGSGYFKGSVGIGVTDPDNALEVNGDISTSTHNQAIMARYSTSNAYAALLGWSSVADGAILQLGNNNANNEIRAGHQSTGGGLKIITNNTADYTAAHNGTVALAFTSAGNATFGGDVMLKGTTSIYNNEVFDVLDASGHISLRITNHTSDENSPVFYADHANSADNTKMYFYVDAAEQLRLTNGTATFAGNILAKKVVAGGDYQGLTVHNHGDSNASNTVSIGFTHEDILSANIICGKEDNYASADRRLSNLIFQTHNSANAYQDVLKLDSSNNATFGGKVTTGDRIQVNQDTAGDQGINIQGTNNFSSGNGLEIRLHPASAGPYHMRLYSQPGGQWAERFSIDWDGNIVQYAGSAIFSGSVLPAGNNTQDLGSSAKRWANLYIADLNLKNDRGDWTVIEEEEYLSLKNNKNGKTYKLVMEEV